MKRFLSALLLLPACAAAHIVAVHPVKVLLKADPGLLRVTVEADALSWRLIAGVSAPEGGGPWPDGLRRHCMEYLEGHFPLAVDGRPLKGRVLGGRTARPLWKNDLGEVLVVHAVYDLPEGGDALTARADFFREDWERLEGAGGKGPRGTSRDFRTFVRWGSLPGSALRATIQDPGFSLPLRRVRRPAVARWLESAGLGVRAIFGLSGALVLVAAAMFFPPGRWSVPWLAGAAIGALFGVPHWVSAGTRLRDATGFAGFSWGTFLLSGPLLLAGGAAFRRLFSLGYRRYFRFLTPDELERQALFHRKIAARLAAISAFYWVLSPLWTKAP